MRAFYHLLASFFIAQRSFALIDIQQHATHSLWTFAVALHALPGQEQQMLELQDNAGIDIPELLFYCWLERRHEHLRTPAQLEEIRRWQQRFTVPLRLMRRELKPLLERSPPLATMRNAIKSAELESERETLRRLALLERDENAPSEQAWQLWHGKITAHHGAIILKVRQAAQRITLE
ncbi:TIGR02444 family protein [Carnimonas bestiolae]|uniref:TIGR02444 family protein n=1 Tax=Carnimonas bestiolae TaxID=3402172 RepID=UPI003F4ABFD4